VDKKPQIPQPKAKQATPMQLLKHQFKPGMAYMQRLAKGQRGK
jgi:hypothetical protein